MRHGRNIQALEQFRQHRVLDAVAQRFGNTSGLGRLPSRSISRRVYRQIAERPGGVAAEGGAIGACRALDGIVEAASERAGGVASGAPGTFDCGCGLLRDHAGRGRDGGGVLVGRGEDVEDVAHEHLVDALELAVQDLRVGEALLEVVVDGSFVLAVRRVGPEDGEIDASVLERDLRSARRRSA